MLRGFHFCASHTRNQAGFVSLDDSTEELCCGTEVTPAEMGHHSTGDHGTRSCRRATGSDVLFVSPELCL